MVTEHLVLATMQPSDVEHPDLNASQIDTQPPTANRASSQNLPRPVQDLGHTPQECGPLAPCREYYTESRSFRVLVRAGLIAIITLSCFTLANLTLWNNGIQDLNRTLLPPFRILGSFTLCVLCSLVLDSNEGELWGIWDDTHLHSLCMLAVFMALIISSVFWHLYVAMQFIAGGIYVFFCLVRFNPRVTKDELSWSLPRW
jgi:hypothetical protein